VTHFSHGLGARAREDDTTEINSQRVMVIVKRAARCAGRRGSSFARLMFARGGPFDFVLDFDFVRERESIPK
jgi:hypothetical protein